MKIAKIYMKEDCFTFKGEQLEAAPLGNPLSLLISKIVIFWFWKSHVDDIRAIIKKNFV